MKKGDTFYYDEELFQVTDVNYASDQVEACRLYDGLVRVFSNEMIVTNKIKPIGNTSQYSTVCECGSEKTYGPDTPFHSTWCPKWKAP